MIKSFDISSRFILGCSLALMLSVPLHGAQARFVHFFTGKDGARPAADLITDSAGNFYGTTTFGGKCNMSSFGCGTVFKLAPNGAETVLYSFKGGRRDGAYPWSGLITDSSGNFYGTTNVGGSTGCGGQGCGTVFKLASNGTETVLYSFTQSDGLGPSGRLVRDSAGNLYGETLQGGAYGWGTVFKVAPDGTEATFYSFKGANGDGGWPEGRLIADSAGNLYGTTYRAGAYGAGTVFKLAPDGTETVLHAFTAGNDGSAPQAGLMMDGEGNLYGTTAVGGAGCNCGTVFKVAPDGTETVLHAFAGGLDGNWPAADLISDRAGNLYGTTYRGGGVVGCSGFGCGTVYRLAPDGTETVLQFFTGGAGDGSGPEGGVIRDGTGHLYGTTGSGGRGCSDFNDGCGTIFKIKR